MAFSKTIADVCFGEEEFWTTRIVFEFLAQLADESAQIFEFAAILVTPNRGEQACVRERSTGMVHKALKKTEFLGREMDRFALLTDLAALDIELDITDHDHSLVFVLRRAGTPNSCADARHQFTDVEGLGNIVVRPGVQCLDFVFLAVANCDHDNR